MKMEYEKLAFYEQFSCWNFVLLVVIAVATNHAHSSLAVQANFLGFKGEYWCHIPELSNITSLREEDDEVCYNARERSFTCGVV